MFVAASTGCFPELNLQDAMEKLADLEYTTTEIVVNEDHGQIRPSELVSKFDAFVQICRTSRRITPCSFLFDVDAEHENFFELFKACSKLAKATKVVNISIKPGKLGTPFNAEVERLQKLVKTGVHDGVHVAVMTESDSLTENPETLGSLCKSIPGLTVCLDPSHYIFGCPKPLDYDCLAEYVSHVRLRDSTRDVFQVQIGQGIIEYGRLVIQLGKVGYRRALCVDLAVIPNVDPIAELRKMRLLLESLL